MANQLYTYDGNSDFWPPSSPLLACHAPADQDAAAALPAPRQSSWAGDAGIHIAQVTDTPLRRQLTGSWVTGASGGREGELKTASGYRNCAAFVLSEWWCRGSGWLWCLLRYADHGQAVWHSCLICCLLCFAFLLVAHACCSQLAPCQTNGAPSSAQTSSDCVLALIVVTMPSPNAVLQWSTCSPNAVLQWSMHSSSGDGRSSKRSNGSSYPSC